MGKCEGRLKEVWERCRGCGGVWKNVLGCKGK